MKAVVAAGPSLDALYDRIDVAGRAALAEDRLDVDPLPVDGGMRWGISAVFRPRPWTAALTQCARELVTALGPDHAVYGSDAFHVTLRQFEGYRASIPDDDPRLCTYRTVLSSLPIDLRIRLCGLTASPAGILVRGVPQGDLQRLRGELHDRLAAGGSSMQGPEATRGQLRESAHASLVVYGGRVRPADAVAALVERHRTTDFGTFTFDRVSLVGYRRTRRDVTLVEYGEYGDATSRSHA